MKSKEKWEEKCIGLRDVLSAWLLVLMVLSAMNAVLAPAGGRQPHAQAPPTHLVGHGGDQASALEAVQNLE